MRIGVVSDTHNNLKNVRKIVELFNTADVDAVIHTGDISQPKTLEVFAGLSAPMVGVFGNNDQEREGLAQAIAKHGFEFHEPPLELSWHSRSILVAHDPLELEGVCTPQHELVLHGHTHLYRLEQSPNQTIFNPGECAGHLTGYNAIGVVDLSTMACELLKF